MTRRIVGLIAAVVLALVGTVALVAYVTTAEQRALAGEELVEVYVVAVPIPSGTPGESVADHVTVEQVPAKVRAVGAVDNLQAVAGLVAGVDLVVGEQLVAGRFTEQAEVASRQVGIEVPEHMLEVTIETDAQRAVGGLLKPGQLVAVLASFSPFEASSATTEIDGEIVAIPAAAGLGEGASPTTDFLLRKVLITAVQEQSGRPPDDQRVTTSPGGSLFVTFALDPVDAERLVFTAENGSIWLAIERETVPDDGTPGQSRANVLTNRAGAS